MFPVKSATHSSPPELAMSRALMPVTVNVVAPAGLPGGIRITLSPLAVHRLPSGPVVIARGSVMSSTGKLVNVAGAAGGTFRSFAPAVTQRFPSGPLVTPLAPFTPVRSNSSTVPSGLTRATFGGVPSSTTQTLPSAPAVSLYGVPLTANAPATAGVATAAAGTAPSAATRQASRTIRRRMRQP